MGGMSHKDDPSSEEKARADYAGKVRAIRILHGQDTPSAEMEMHDALGRNVMREETGFFGPWRGAGYSFDKATQDRLLAHTRQDVAATYAMAKSAFRDAHHARRAAQRAQWFLIASLALNVAVLASLWLRG